MGAAIITSYVVFLFQAGWPGAQDTHLDQAASFDFWEKSMSNPGAKTSGAVALPGDQVLTIAQADALRLYRDLSPYRIQLALEDDGWHVDYELTGPKLKAGGPHYAIDAHTGAILTKRYEQ
jgi:hypothetical protein